MPYGKIDSFDLSSRKWKVYVNRVKQYIALNEIKESLHVATLITVVGGETYDLMSDLCAPISPENKTFTELVDIVQQHLEPRRSDIAERHIFRLRRQKPGEELSMYLQSLKHLASSCNFGEKLEENLRDQFVSGLASDDMRSRLFAEKDLEYGRAVDLALALEAAERHAETSSAGAGAGATSGAATASALSAVHRMGATAPASARISQSCWRCGRQHSPDKCRFRRFNCDECGARGHLKVMCRSARGAGSRSVTTVKKNQFYIDANSETEGSDFYNIYVNGKDDEPYVLKLIIDEIPIVFEVDTGSKISVISESDFNKYFNSYKVMECDLKLKTYTGARIVPIGFIMVSARYDSLNNGEAAGSGETREAHGLRLYVIRSDGGPPLIGRAWLRCLQLKNIIISMNHLQSYNSGNETDRIIASLKNEFFDVFASGLGTCVHQFSLKLKDKEPIFYKARTLPFALRGPVEKELERLVREGTIVKISNSEYGTPIVPIVKKCGGIRICGDYKITVNPKLIREPYPLPRIEELYSALRGAQIFSKIDLAHAYEQFILTPESRPCTTISTHIGTFQYIRTPYGLSCIPEKFQKTMEELLRGVPMTAVYFDDICVGGFSKENNIHNLREVLRRLKAVGLRIKLEKCDFFKSEVCYLGHVIDKRGLHPDTKKVKAISDAPRPSDVHQLKAFLGLVNYYGKFIRNLSSILHPLYQLLKHKVSWVWSNDCERSFNKIKCVLSGDQFLAHYDPSLPVVLSVDSSAYGLGAVLAHRYSDGSERPICCTSRTLNNAERSYSQLDKEALAIFFGVIKNHQYLFGRRFIIRTDHKPLSYIFGDKIGIPQTAASRLQRYAARLAAYDFSVEWVSSARNAPADCLSRLPLSREVDATTTEDISISYLFFVESEFPINHKDIASATNCDPVLRVIYQYILFGWPDSTDVEQEKAYFHRKNNLFVEHGCIVYNYRVVIPPKFREYILRELHEGHLGVVKMKSIARNYVYWPCLDADIELLCRSCTACRQQRDAPPHAPLTPWEFPSRPWQRLHLDFGEYNSKHYLIIVDSHSKWIEVFQMNGTAAKFVITKLRELFARFGLPLQVVSDNGPPFTSYEIQNYFKKNGIIHNLTSPYRPQGNGAAENAVKTVKNCIKKAHYEGVDVEIAIHKMLFQYRNCEHATTGVAPSVAMLGRKVRGRLDALRPNTEERVRAKQLEQVTRSGGKLRPVEIGDNVYVRDYTKNRDKWVEGQVKGQVGPSSYTVSTKSNTVRRHIDQIIIPKSSSKRFSLSCTSDGIEQMNAEDSVTNDIVSTPVTTGAQGSELPANAVVADGVSPPSDIVALSDNPPSVSEPTVALHKNLRPRRTRAHYWKSDLIILLIM